LIVIVVKSEKPPKLSTSPAGSVTDFFLPFLTTTCRATIGSAYDLRAARISNGYFPAIRFTPRSKSSQAKSPSTYRFAVTFGVAATNANAGGSLAACATPTPAAASATAAVTAPATSKRVLFMGSSPCGGRNHSGRCGDHESGLDVN
jgi:hypothetical protein